MTFPVGIAFDEALALLRQEGISRRLPIERVALREARGRVLGEQLVAPMSLPGFDNSAMDGFALRAQDLAENGATRLRLVGTQFAGARVPLGVGAGECIRITTGAILPAAADTVAIKESSRVEGDVVLLAPGTVPGANVRRAGSDVESGDAIFDPGTTLGSAALGLIAALGLASVPVARRPSVAVFTSGDELRPLGSALGEGEIHDSNRVLLQALLAEEGIETLSWPALPDDAERIRAALSDAAEAYDLILTCGGVSAGEKDLLPQILRDHGRTHFWKVRMRPGMPVLFGQWGQALLLGLPGNPVSVLATFRRLVVPLLDALQGRADRAPPLYARLLECVAKSNARLEFRRARLSCDGSGQLGVRPHPAAGSHQQRGAAESNALMLLPEDCRELDVGALVEVEPYGAILRT
jgi:molybdopterin molybdotransferase